MFWAFPPWRARHLPSHFSLRRMGRVPRSSHNSLNTRDISISLYGMAMTSDQAVEVLRAPGESTRLRILSLLAREEFAVLELTRILGQSQPRVSRHLKLLADA